MWVNRLVGLSVVAGLCAVLQMWSFTRRHRAPGRHGELGGLSSWADRFVYGLLLAMASVVFSPTAWGLMLASLGAVAGLAVGRLAGKAQVAAHGEGQSGVRRSAPRMSWRAAFLCACLVAFFALLLLLATPLGTLVLRHAELAAGTAATIFAALGGLFCASALYVRA
jgi:hypothetical protein